MAFLVLPVAENPVFDRYANRTASANENHETSLVIAAVRAPRRVSRTLRSDDIKSEGAESAANASRANRSLLLPLLLPQSAVFRTR